MDETALTAAPGAYMLFIELEGALALPATSRGSRTLAPGRHAYCGSAYGPGGLRARLRRHLKREKARRWHVDHLYQPSRIDTHFTALSGPPEGVAALAPRSFTLGPTSRGAPRLPGGPGRPMKWVSIRTGWYYG